MNRAIYCLKNEQSSLEHAINYSAQTENLDRLRVLRKDLREVDEALALLEGIERGDQMYEKLKGGGENESSYHPTRTEGVGVKELWR